MLQMCPTIIIICPTADKSTHQREGVGMGILPVNGLYCLPNNIYVNTSHIASREQIRESAMWHPSL